MLGGERGPWALGCRWLVRPFHYLSPFILLLPDADAAVGKQVEFTSVLDGMAAAQLADIFVGVHGANMGE